MAVVTLVGSRIMDGLDNTPVDLASPGLAGGDLQVWVETVECNADDDTGSTYHLARLPSNARILGISKLSWDDLATSGAPTLDIGIYNRSGASDITNDVDALSSGHAVSSASSGNLLAGIATYGDALWEYVTSETVDPKVSLDIKAVLADAAVTTAGTITVEIYYTID